MSPKGSKREQEDKQDKGSDSRETVREDETRDKEER